MSSCSREFTLSDFDFELPEALIAQHPTAVRSARLLDGRDLTPTDRIFRELPDLLQPGDLLVFNDTKVIKARVFGEKASGGKIEILVERVLQNKSSHMRVSKKPLPGAKIHLCGGLKNGGFKPRWAAGPMKWPAVPPLASGQQRPDPYELLEQFGHLPCLLYRAPAR